MLQMHLRGYVTPEDFSGSDTQRLQKALDTSRELDIGRVVLSGSYTVDQTVWVSPMTDIVLEGAALTAAGDFPMLANRNLAEADRHSYSFQEQFITLRGNGKLAGNVVFYNAFHVNINGPEFLGDLRFFFTREVRLYNSRFSGKNGVVLGMGSNNFIMQNLTADCCGTAIVMDTTETISDYVIGKEADIHDIILQDSTFHTTASAVTMNGTDGATIYNVQMDHLSSNGVTLEVGTAGTTVSESCYFNLTGEHFRSGVQESIVLNNAVKHCYFPG